MKKTYVQPQMDLVEFDEDLCELGGWSTVDPDDVLSKRNTITFLSDGEEIEDTNDNWGSAWD